MNDSSERDGDTTKQATFQQSVINHATSEPISSLAIPYEMRIGVTGHRQLADPEGVRQALTSVIQQIVTVLTEASRVPHGPHGSERDWTHHVDRCLTWMLSVSSKVLSPVVNLVFRMIRAPERWHWPVVPLSSTNQPAGVSETPLKLTGISCLAAGSDQIFVEVIRDLLTDEPLPGLVPASDRNRFIEAVLPFRQDDYERNFPVADELQSFRNSITLNQGRTGETLPTIVFPEFPFDKNGTKISKTEAYMAANRYLVESSEILIAVWDPTHDENPGGTAKTARFAIERGQIVIWINPNRLSDGPRLLTAASGQTPEANQQSVTANGAVPAGLTAAKMPQRAKQLSPHFHQMAAYNRDQSVPLSDLKKAIAVEMIDFRKQASEQLEASVADAVVAIASHIIPHQVRADRLSAHYQSLREAAKQIWPTLTALAVTLMGFQILFLPNWYWLAWGEVAILAICAVAFRISLHEAWHDKWRNNRRLAESLRIATYSSGVAFAQDATSNSARKFSPGEVRNPLPFYHPGQTWLVSAVKRLSYWKRQQAAPGIDWDEDTEKVAKYLAANWIDSQAEHHFKTAKRHHNHAGRFLLQRRILIGVIVAVALLHALGIGHSHEPHGHVSVFFRFDLWVAFATVALPAWAAALHALSSMEDHERLAARSKRMAALLNDLAARVRSATSLSQLKKLVAEAEWLFDLETREWAESLSDRLPEFTG